MSLPLFPAPLIKLLGQNFNFGSFLWGTYKNSLFQCPLYLRGFHTVRRVSCQRKSMPIKIQSHPGWNSYRKFFLPMYLIHGCSEVSKRNPGWKQGDPLSGRVAEALKYSLEQDEPFPAKRASKENWWASICTSEPKSRMPRAGAVISYHTSCPQMHLRMSSMHFCTGVNKISHLKETWGVSFGLFSYPCEASTGQLLDFGFYPVMKKKCPKKIML